MGTLNSYLLRITGQITGRSSVGLSPGCDIGSGKNAASAAASHLQRSARAKVFQSHGRQVGALRSFALGFWAWTGPAQLSGC